MHVCAVTNSAISRLFIFHSMSVLCCTPNVPYIFVQIQQQLHKGSISQKTLNMTYLLYILVFAKYWPTIDQFSKFSFCHNQQSINKNWLLKSYQT